MAVKKSASSTSPKAKATDAPAPKSKAVEVKSASAAKKETAPRTTTPAPKSAAATPAVAKSAAPKSAAAPAAAKSASPKKSPAAAVKLTSTQTDLLGRVHGAVEPGYRSEKKNEQRTLDALRERKLIKRGAKHKQSGNFHYLISTAGKKHVDVKELEDASFDPENS